MLPMHHHFPSVCTVLHILMSASVNLSGSSNGLRGAHVKIAQYHSGIEPKIWGMENL